MKIDETPLNMVALSIVSKSIEPVKEFYNIENKEDNKLKDFVYELLTREEKKREVRLLKHRHGLKRENNREYKKIRPKP